MNTVLSVIIPAFNREHLISMTLDSVISQTFKDWECIVVDDSSTDRTQEVVRSYALKDDRIRLVVNHFSKGAPGARNTGIDHATGEFICFFDSDDLMYPNHLESKMYIASQFPDVGVFTSYSHLLNESNEIMGSFNYNAEGNIFNDLLLEKTYVDTNSALIRKSTLTESIRWDEKCPSYQEWDFHLQLSKLTTYKTVPEYLSGYYRRTQGTISSDGIRTIHGRWFVFLIDFMDKDAYYATLHSIDVGIFYSVRPQAAGNINWFLGNHRPVVLLKENTLFHFYKRKGFELMDTESFDAGMSKTTSKTRYSRNAEIMKLEFGEEVTGSRYRMLLEIDGNMRG